MTPPKAPALSPPFASAMVRDLVTWVLALLFAPRRQQVFTIATLPSATTYPGATVPVSDGTGGKPTVTSIGGAWTYPDGSAA